MFQDFALFPNMTLIDNVRYGLRTLPKAAQREIALAALRRVGLGRLADSYPHTLSGGEQQRVAMARALVPRPQVLLMDEPFSGLDSRLRDEMRSETLAILRETRATAVVVTHDAEEAMRLGDASRSFATDASSSAVPAVNSTAIRQTSSRRRSSRKSIPCPAS